MNSKSTPETMYNGMRVLAIAMQKGGTGKTTLGLHLAIRAALGHIPEIKKKVLIIDVDQQQNSSKTLLKMETIAGDGSPIPPIHPNYDPNDPDDSGWGGRSNSLDLYYDNEIQPYPSALSERLEILPADGNALWRFDKIKKGQDQSLLDSIYKHMHLFFMEKDVQDLYDLVIIDCPPGKTLITTPVMRAATDIILPAQPETFGVDGTHKMIFDVMRENEYRKCPINFIGVIPNLCDRTNDHKTKLAALRSNSLTAPYTAPFSMHRYVSMRIESLPMESMTKCTLGNKKAESQVQRFVEYVGDSMFKERRSY